jgi:hypothetical protein
MAFNPELGSTSPAVLLDNAERLDKLVNGPALTEPDRAGDDLDTWRGMMAKNNAAIDESAQNYHPGLPLATLLMHGLMVHREYPDGAQPGYVVMTRRWQTSTSTTVVLCSYRAKDAVAEYIDDGFTPGRVVESDTDVAIALTFAEGSRSWLEVRLMTAGLLSTLQN